MNKESTDMFRELVEARYSCRKYDSARVPSREQVESVFEDARLAPSACNRQPWQFWVVGSESPRREAVIASYSREWIRTAPLYIICLGVENEGWVRPFDSHSHIDVDLSIAAEHICLSAASRGLATCWVCNFDPHIIVDGFNIPEGLEPVAILPIGFAAPDCPVPVKTRKSADEIIQWGKF